ncbi:Retrotransposon gag domain [Sesbania bispinosa]|nr:Retrotransposon gag domain [Sesbania bispinosa]
MGRGPSGKKLEIPVFSGDEAYGWIIRIERFLRVNDKRDEEKMEAVLVALEDRALHWYQWWEEQTPSPTWDQFKAVVIRRFQLVLVQNPFGPLLSIKQTGTVMEYQEKFEMVSAPLKDADKLILKGIFLNGLQEELQAELKLYNSENLSELMDRALLLEEKNWALKRGGIGRRQVLILVDCGATSSFISRELVAKLNLPIENTPEYNVEVGTGEKVKGRGLCKDVDLEVQDELDHKMEGRRGSKGT